MVQDGDNDPYQVNNPPNHLMIKAATVITDLSGQLQQAGGIINNLQRQLQELAEQHELLQKSRTAAETVTGN